MVNVRTSHSHPLQIAVVSKGKQFGRIGITFCPGKQDLFAHTGSWRRDLSLDLTAIKHWGAALVVTLVEPAELNSLKVPELGKQVQERGMEWIHLPIADYSIPDQQFEQQWLTQGARVRALLREGKDILVHCKGGLGRAGMIAARLLIELGMDPEMAINKVRDVRKGAIETPSQLALVRKTKAIDLECVDE